MNRQKLNPTPQRQKTEIVQFTWIDWGKDAHGTRIIRIFFENDPVIVEPLSTFNGPPRVLFKLFGDAGHLVTKMEQLEPLLAEVNRAMNNDAQSFICVPLGWNEKLAAYIGTPKIYGEPPQGMEIIPTFGYISQTKFDMRGSKEQWDEIAKLSHGNSRYMFAIGCALAGPVLDILELPSIAFQLFGPPSIGKTTLLKVAGSVWGADLTAPHRSFLEILPSRITELH